MLCREYVDKTLMEADRKEAIGIAILVVVLLVSPIIIILVKNAAATIQVISDVTNVMQYLNISPRYDLPTAVCHESVTKGQGAEA